MSDQQSSKSSIGILHPERQTEDSPDHISLLSLSLPQPTAFFDLEPQLDITAWELVMILKRIAIAWSGGTGSALRIDNRLWERLPDSAKRHFKEVL